MRNAFTDELTKLGDDDERVVMLSGDIGNRLFDKFKAKHDLTREPDVKRLFDDTKPQVVIHLAAVVGGIGANRDNPGTFFYQNVMMGALTMEYARRVGVEKFVPKIGSLKKSFNCP